MIRTAAIGTALLLAACSTDTGVRNGPQSLSPSGGAAMSVPVATAAAPMAAGPSVMIVQAQPAPVNVGTTPVTTMTTITERAGEWDVLGMIGNRLKPGTLVGTTVYTTTGN